MDTNKPRVSIGVPVYNGEAFLGLALDSLLNQTFTDFEVVISDNASTDRTREICERYAARDARIRYYRAEQNQGAAWNFNRVVHLARGEYFHWQAHDDIVCPEFLEKTVAVLDQRPDVVLASTQVDLMDDHGDWVELYDIQLKTSAPLARQRFRSLLMDYHLCYEIFGLIRTAALRQTDLIGNFGHGDGILLEQLCLLGPFYEVPEPLFNARVHARQSMKMYGVLGQKKDNNYHEYTVWFDPSKAGRIIFPTWRILAEHWRTLWRGRTGPNSRLGPLDMAYGLFFLAYWTARRRRALLKDVWIAARQWLSRAVTPQPANPSPEGSRQ